MTDFRQSPVLVAGAHGMVGSAIVRRLRLAGYKQILCPTRSELDLSSQTQVDIWMGSHRPALVFVAAAKVGGIHANNSFPADFLLDNLLIETNLIRSAFRSGCSRLLFLGSSCIYPKMAKQPIIEESLLSGPLEPSNEAYALAKIAGIKLCESYRRQHGSDFRSLMPCNLYGPGDNFHSENSHVIPAMLRRLADAVRDGREVVTMWGSGSPLREFLHVDDLADACLRVAELPELIYWSSVNERCTHLNCGGGEEITILELAELCARTVGYAGRFEWDSSRPDGTPRKVMDSSKLRQLGWSPAVKLETGLADAWSWYCEHYHEARGRR